MNAREIADGMALGDAVGSVLVVRDQTDEGFRDLIVGRAACERLAKGWVDGDAESVARAIEAAPPLLAAALAAGVAYQLGERGLELAAYLTAVWTATR